MSEFLEEDIFKSDTDIESLQKQVEDLKNSLNGLNPRNLAGLNSSTVYNAIFPNINDGSDGELNIASGTTTLDLGGVSTFVKNYSIINIASGATLTFSNPANNGTIVVLKCRGDVTVTGTINGAALGAAAQYPAYGTINYSNQGANGGNGPDSNYVPGGATTTATFYPLNITGKVVKVTPGAGGGNGGDTNFASGGAGGRGGIGLIIECRGKYSCTGTISLAGANGSAGSSGGGNGTGGGGGGGGAGGILAVLYGQLGVNTGTYTITGGNGGDGGTGINDFAAGGGAGGGNLYSGGAGGRSGTNGSAGGGTGGGTGGSGAGGTGTACGGGGGGGSAGGYYVVLNTEFI